MNLTQKYCFIVKDNDFGKKLVTFIGEHYLASARAIKRTIEQNGAFINGKCERFASTKLKAGDEVHFIPVLESQIITSLYEDDFIQVIDKPAGIVSSPESFPERLLVHRLDKETTGCLILAKTPEAQKNLEEQFRNRTVKKQYVAICHGVPKESEGILQTRLAAVHRYQGQTVYGSGKEGKLAITHWRVMKRSKGSSLIMCRPQTGRTHQIRVHLKELGVPIVGDYQYDRKKNGVQFARRLLLHAEKVCFTHPVSGKETEVAAPWPQDFLEYFS